ncbi:hypothetical protein HDV02_003929 [Globomyces sp. JEL0801]|nr:hypothetical protein HDV02_003929 [Globomyces sp. JEL0801]
MTLTIDSIPEASHRKLPSDFVWGSATAAYQVEGAYDEDGRTLSIWDTFSKLPERTIDGLNGDFACDQYHLYEKDFDLLQQHGAKAYRLSLSWSRILPNGFKGTPTNQLAIAHYRRVFDALLIRGIQPWVTLYHWDLPQCLQDEYDGFLNTERLVEDFNYYADVCFNEFGDQVKHWMTLNEPWTFCKLGFGLNGPHAPGRTNDRSRSEFGNPGVEVWRAGHTSLLAHAKAVETYREKYQREQQGVISLALNTDWFEPLTDSPKDVEAAQRRLDFMLGWFSDPLFLTGDYPASMRKQLGDRLPRFTPEQSKSLLGSCDYYAFNHYTSQYCSATGIETPDINDLDGNVTSSFYDVNGVLIGNKGAASWLYDCPWGFKKLLLYIKDRYNNPNVVITENGFCVAGESDATNAVHDVERIHYYHGYITSLVECVADHGCNITDNFEWAMGYTERFGITYVNYDTQERIPKDSFKFIQNYFNLAIKPKTKKIIKRVVTRKVTLIEPGKTTVTTTVTTHTPLK